MISAGRQHQDAAKIAAHIALSVMVILAIGAVVFWQERMLFGDAAYISFRIINFGELQIQERRYGSAFTQVVPLIGAKLHWPLKVILAGYSLSFNLLYLGACWALVKIFKTYHLAILMALYYTLLAGQTYYWTNNEVHQGIAFLFLFFGWIEYSGTRKVQGLLMMLISCILLFFAVFSHPLVAMPALYLWAFLLLDKDRRRHHSRNRLIFISVAMAVCVAARIAASHGSWYDGSKLDKALTITPAAAAAAFGNDMSLGFLRATWTHLWQWPAIAIAGILALAAQKRWLALLCTVGAAGGFYLLVCLVNERYWDFYSESEWMALTIIIAAPAVYFGLPKLGTRAGAAAVALICLLRLIDIGRCHEKFTSRLAVIDAILDKAKEKHAAKTALIKDGTQLEQELIMTWALPVESMYRSSLRGTQPLNTIIEINADSRARAESGKSAILIAWDTYTPAQLNSDYFTPDTTQTYLQTTYPELLR